MRCAFLPAFSRSSTEKPPAPTAFFLGIFRNTFKMESLVREAAIGLDFDEGQANMLGACGRNIYAMGCGYHPTTVTILEEICNANTQESWAILLLRCLEGTMPRLRSEATATARMNAARAAAARRRAMAAPARRKS